MPEFQIDNAPLSPFNKDVWRDLSELERGFVEAMFFTSTGPDAEIEDANVNELADCALVWIKKVCAEFEASPWFKLYDADDTIENKRDTESVGNDLWFSSQGHGCGFWEGASRGYPGHYQNTLDASARKACREGVYLYRGDDGVLYLS
jgi:hypothetical protein